MKFEQYKQSGIGVLLTGDEFGDKDYGVRPSLEKMEGRDAFDKRIDGCLGEICEAIESEVLVAQRLGHNQKITSLLAVKKGVEGFLDKDNRLVGCGFENMIRTVRNTDSLVLPARNIVYEDEGQLRVFENFGSMVMAADCPHVSAFGEVDAGFEDGIWASVHCSLNVLADANLEDWSYSGLIRTVEHLLVDLEVEEDSLEWFAGGGIGKDKYIMSYEHPKYGEANRRKREFLVNTYGVDAVVDFENGFGIDLYRIIYLQLVDSVAYSEKLKDKFGRRVEFADVTINQECTASRQENGKFVFPSNACFEERHFDRMARFASVRYPFSI
jgi:hypothetical protein